MLLFVSFFVTFVYSRRGKGAWVFFIFCFLKKFLKGKGGASFIFSLFLTCFFFWRGGGGTNFFFVDFLLFFNYLEVFLILLFIFEGERGHGFFSLFCYLLLLLKGEGGMVFSMFCYFWTICKFFVTFVYFLRWRAMGFILLFVTFLIIWKFFVTLVYLVYSLGFLPTYTYYFGHMAIKWGQGGQEVNCQTPSRGW